MSYLKPYPTLLIGVALGMFVVPRVMTKVAGR
mgnify:CR=1 FL=1